MQINNIDTSLAKIAVIRFTKHSILETDRSTINIDSDVKGICILYPSCRKLNSRHAMARKCALQIIKMFTSKLTNQLKQSNHLIPINKVDYEVYLVLPNDTDESYKKILHELGVSISELV